MGLKYISPIALLFLLLTGCNRTKEYDPSACLSDAALSDVHWKIVHYLGKPPEDANTEDIFNKRFDDHYRQQLSINRIDKYYIDKETQTHYFLASRIAPSLTEKRVATGGKLKIDDKKNISEYEEIFRTWKMVPDTLTRRAGLLFDKMVKGKSLERYLAKNSNGVDYIEFPDERVVYDKEQRKWVTK